MFVVSIGLLFVGCTSSKAKPIEPQAADPAAPETVHVPQVPEVLKTEFGKEEAKGESASPSSNAVIYPGSGTFVKPPPKAKASIGSNGDVSLTFVDTDIRDVAKAVLGDALKLNYSIDPSIQGKVTIQTSTPIERSAVLPTLEIALRMNGVALVQQKGLYLLSPLADAQKRATVPRIAGGDERGYGQQIVQLRYVSVADMQRVLGAIAPQSGVVYADKMRNLLVLSGTEQEVSTLLDTIALFDVDYLKSMSFGVFTPENVTADELAKDLTTVVGGADSPIGGILKFVPIPRINALLVIAQEPRLLDDVQLWVKRLDVEGEGPAHRRLYLYRVQSAKAADLADTLGRLFGAATSTTAKQDLTKRDATDRLNSFGSRGLTGQQGGGFATPGYGTSPVSASPRVRDTSSTQEDTTTSSADTTQPGEKDTLRIVADERNNLLMILATPREHREIESALKEIDIPPDQVLIEATIAEVSLTNELKYGTQWFFKSARNNFTFSEDAAGKILSKFPGFSYTYMMPDVQVALNALASRTNVKVISSPKMMVLDNQPATLEVGDEVPIATQSAVSVLNPDSPIVNTIQFRQTGVILDVTPRISKSGLVIMDVSQEVSDVATTTTSTLNSPTIQQRKFMSTVAVQSGATVALGGLIRDNVSKGKDGLPVFKDVPLLGGAFRSTNNSKRRTELLVFITPRIVRTTDEAKEMTEYLRSKLREASLIERPKH